MENRVDLPVAGIILAAGASTRLGQPKQLLPWRGQPVICHVAQTALSASLDPVVVVTGAVDDLIQKALAGLAVQVVHNPAWAEGQSASVRCGLQALPDAAGAVVILLADQPQVPVTLVGKLVEIYRSQPVEIVAPQVQDRRANPVLFDRSVFSDLLALQGDTGGRAVFSHHTVTWLPWLDDSLLLDIDTWEDYQRLLALA